MMDMTRQQRSVFDMGSATSADGVRRSFASASVALDHSISRRARLCWVIGRVVAPLALIVCSQLLNPAILHSQVERAADAPQPFSAEASKQHFQLHDGFRIELVASEPLLSDPSAILVDHRGRMFVSELHGYNLEGHLDIVELNLQGKLDREVRRVRVEGELLDRAKQARTGTVKQLIDLDGDGQMDDHEVWADDLPPCYGMVAYRDGIIVVCGPDIVFLADRDQDGRAEVRELLFTGFDVEVMERAINNPRWGLDGWVYVATGGGESDGFWPSVEGPSLSWENRLSLPPRWVGDRGSNWRQRDFRARVQRLWRPVSNDDVDAVHVCHSHSASVHAPQSLHCLAGRDNGCSALQQSLSL